MKLSLVFLAGVCTLVASANIPYQETVKDKEFLTKQQKVINLIYHVNQKSHIPEHVQIAESYDMKEHAHDYKHPEVVDEFLHHYENGMLHRDEVFSIFHKPHLEQAIALFRVLYHAKDFDTFHKTAVWARQHLNPALFVYSFHVAMIHRHDTQDLMLPPIYEILPHHFFSSEVIHKAQYLKQVSDSKRVDKVDTDFHGYTIDSNYSGWYLNLHPEQSMSYYLEDIDVNAHHFYHHVYFPFWMHSEEYGIDKHMRGEFFFHHHQQLLARYYLERLSNGFGEVHPVDWEVPVTVPFTPSMVYHNGLEFPSRPKFADLHDFFYRYGEKHAHGNYSYSLQALKTYHRRIVDFIDSGFVYNHKGDIINLHSDEGLGILGNVIEHTADSVNRQFFGPIMRVASHLLGYSPQPLDDHKLIPSALEHYETMLRDPVAYKLFQNVMIYYMKYMSHIHPYTKDELEFPEVEIKEAHVDPLVTYVDHFHSHLDNGVFYGPHEEPHHGTFHARVRQQRVNHKPFSYKLRVKAGKPEKAMVKLFMGPKHDEFGRHANITEHHLHFVELDRHVVELNAGDNMIERSSHDFHNYGPDRINAKKMYEELMNALDGGQDFHVDHRQNYVLRSNRLMLPKGTENGVTYRFFFFVYPYTPHHHVDTGAEHPHEDEDSHKFHKHIILDDKSIYYPLDRFIKFGKVFHNIPNSHFEDVTVHFKDIYEISTLHPHGEHHEH